MKNVYLCTRDSFAKKTLPLLWCSLKTYYEENSDNVSQWNWITPWLAQTSNKEEILDACAKCPPDIFGFSIYIWNEEFFEDLAQAIKQQHPNCLIIYGGPQPNIKYNDNFFKEKHWVDMVVPSDAYGEIIFKEVLDNFPITDYEKIPYVYYPDADRNRCFSKTGIEKRSYKWPQNIFKAQEQHLLPYINEVEVGLIETSRGCPHKCIYCDWGGGIYSKVTKKPYTTVLDELEWLSKNKIKILAFNDANFGIMEIDVEITKQLIELVKKYGYPNRVIAESSKNHLKRTVIIKELMAEHGLLENYKISIQTIDDEIKHNIERNDPPIVDQIESVKYLRKKFPDLPIKVETILGLPGDNYQKTLDQIDLLLDNNINVGRSSVWMLLPESPAFNPVMREQFKIQTVKKTFLTDTWAIKDKFIPEENIFATLSSSWSNQNIESVIGTYSYTPDEWVDMNLITCLAQASDSNGINSLLGTYMKSVHNLRPSDLIDFIYKNYVRPNKFTKGHKLRELLVNAHETIYRWVHDGNLLHAGIDYHYDFPLILSGHTYFGLITLTNHQEFIDLLCTDLAKHYSDLKILDLGIYLKNSILDSEYNPDVGRTFSTRYNWLKFFKDNELDNGIFTYRVDDQDIYIEQQNQKINWHLYRDTVLKHHEQYLYQAVASITYSKLSRNIRLI